MHGSFIMYSILKITLCVLPIDTIFISIVCEMALLLCCKKGNILFGLIVYEFGQNSLWYFGSRILKV